MRIEQSPDLQQGAAHGGAAAAEEHGEGVRGQGDLEVKDGCQDLVGGGEPGRAAALDVAVSKCR
ncbi:hypothetical protein QF032_007693 [Streptomyces achromogenes]|uniref:Uncharacterized protein n=1 Tax=Streptomyces achromogenes TaxID=67255 RepID=A0ABU0QDC4_STRAH|nr:hypothetical protein [Streptomyces achromogenes]MDQ0688657.1 hypothetical protein [Streptomyces achromogenes]MDQ0835849.1 hypothetical protein [Streptomyces achromogenes]